MTQDLYSILGVKSDAKHEAIKKAYKKLARKFHSDLNPGDNAAEERFKEISHAYTILSDPKKKDRYDQFGVVDGEESTQAGGFRVDGYEWDGVGQRDFEDLFQTIFRGKGKSSQPGGPARGQDLVLPIKMSLQQAFTGWKAPLRFNRPDPCGTCKGKGHQKGRGGRCESCHGTGQSKISKGFFRMAAPCSACGGSGIHPPPLCPTCGGSGTLRGKKELTVTIPPGVETGTRIRVKKQGGAGRQGGPRGDFWVECSVQPNPIFQREGPHLRINLPLTLTEATLGGKIEIPTLDGFGKMRIPPGTPSGQVLRLRGKGMPRLRGGHRGDILARIQIIPPKVLDEESQNLLREFSRLNPQSLRHYN